MTERFDYTAYDDGTESIYDRKKDIYYFDSEFCKLDEVLNELEEENEQLKSFKEQNIKEYTKLKKVCNQCKKENEQLKIFLEALKEELSLANRDNDALEKENEQLKEENTELKNDNKRMVKFIMSKGFSLKDYLEWLKKEVWND